MIRFLKAAVLLPAFVTTAGAQEGIAGKDGQVFEQKLAEAGPAKDSRAGTPANRFPFVIGENARNRPDTGNAAAQTGGRKVPAGTAAVRASEKPAGNQCHFFALKVIDGRAGLGISYERILDKKGYVGLQLPLTFMFSDTDAFFDWTRNRKAGMVYVSPSLKIYPFRQVASGKVSYAIGPTLSLGFGRGVRSYAEWDTATNTYLFGEEVVKRFVFGILPNNYLGFQLTPRLQVGINGGFGVRFAEKEKGRHSGTINEGSNLAGEFGFSVGLRF